MNRSVEVLVTSPFFILFKQHRYKDKPIGIEKPNVFYLNGRANPHFRVIWKTTALLLAMAVAVG